MIAPTPILVEILPSEADMTVKKIRDNSYYLKRLQRERPDIYADLMAGKVANESQAFILAGLRKRTTPLDTLTRSWSVASAAERQAFLHQIGVSPISKAVPVRSVPTPVTKVATTKVNIPGSMKIAIQGVMDSRKLKCGDVMRELDRPASDTSFAMALRRDTYIRQDLFDDLEKWLQTQVVT